MGAQSRASVGLLLALFVCGAAVGGVGADPLGDHCAEYFQKVVACLNFATGKAATPTKECCTSVAEIKDSDPKCLCYVIQQTLEGNEQVKKMGIQESRLLQLPSACKLTNANVSDCPKLLNIPANSPEYKMFFINSSAPPTTPSMSSPETASPTKATGTSGGSNHEPQLAGLIASIAMAIFLFFFFSAFPVEVVPTFHT